MNYARVLPFCAILTLATARAGAADPVIFSSFGLGDGFNPNSVYAIGGPTHFEQGQLFRAAVDGRLSSIDLAMTVLTRGEVIVDLMTDNDNRPGTVIESFSFIGRSEEGGILSATSTLRPFLVTDTFYWVLLRPATTSTEAIWNVANTNLTTLHYTKSDLDPPFRRGEPFAAFRLNGDASHPVPEPATLMLLGSGLAAVMIRGRRRARESPRAEHRRQSADTTSRSSIRETPGATRIPAA